MGPILDGHLDLDIVDYTTTSWYQDPYSLPHYSVRNLDEEEVNLYHLRQLDKHYLHLRENSQP